MPKIHNFGAGPAKLPEEVRMFKDFFFVFKSFNLSYSLNTNNITYYSSYLLSIVFIGLRNH